MSTEKTGIKKGMRVYGSNGEKLGIVSRVWMGVGETPTSPQDYFVVGEGGFLGFGERTLYIPFDAVDSVAAGESVALSCSEEECVGLYTTKPEGIKKKEVQIAAATASTTPVIFH